jgi:hypothetical protein
MPKNGYARTTGTGDAFGLLAGRCGQFSLSPPNPHGKRMGFASFPGSAFFRPSDFGLQVSS